MSTQQKFGERRYSVAEMDRMREAIESADRNRIPSSGQIGTFEMARTGAIEHLLRSYMLNGTSPEELEEKARIESEKRCAAGRNIRAASRRLAGPVTI